MCADETTPRTMRTATVGLRVGSRNVQLRFDVPDGPTEPIELLPLFRSVTDVLVKIAAEDAEAAGAAISCRKGCGACCRQVVPVSEVEVESIRRLVDALAEPRRTAVIERFERARQRLADSGLLATLRAPEHVGWQDAEALGIAYFRHGIPCPFLEDESCSIHEERPLACREYLVTSPAADCAMPTSDTIRCVPMPQKLSRAIRRIEDEQPRHFEPWIPMILALEWPRKDDAERHSGTSMVARAFTYLTRSEVPDPESQPQGTPAPD
jgi:Fe-S-cluster containining protein